LFAQAVFLLTRLLPPSATKLTIDMIDVFFLL
jgi:hypothetical protein